MRRSFVVLGVLLSLMLVVPANALSTDFVADLAAANEVGGGDGDARGVAEIRLRPQSGELCYRITTSGLSTSPFAAHIHVGEAGVNGGVVIDLQWAANARGNNARGCVPADHAVMMDIVNNPRGYYVNVHNATVPSGAVRGQLVPR